ncbi:MAG TPA: type III-B CRISPR module-associated Cmr3 family protein, partial [Spirochaetia bacterium]|nr:type III-B CRISPR module-associated Cmr3 family protein [Spirochaetia bacterium]
DGPEFRDTATGLYLSLSPIEAHAETNNTVVATGKIQYVGGWDLRIGFHKPMKGYFPAGSVFSRAVSEQCIELPERK